MLSFLKLIRVQNLLIIAFTQYVVRWCLIFPILKAQSSYFELQLSELQFFLLVLSTVMIAAAGYIINDYFDVRTDKLNHPERLVIDKGIKRRVAMGAHMVINILAFMVGLYVSYSVGAPKLAFAHFMCISGLWFYSTTFKKQFLLGNLVIAAFTAIVPFVVAVYESLACYKAYLPIDDKFNLNSLWIYCAGICFFTFLISLIREIIKDIEKQEGDREHGYNTIPIAIGVKFSKLIILSIIAVLLLFLTYHQVKQFVTKDYLTIGYFLIALQLPLLYLGFKVIKASAKADFEKAEAITKGIMFAGICYLFVFAYIILDFIKMI